MFYALFRPNLQSMVGKLNSDAAAPTAAAAAGPRSGQALAAQIVQRAREGGAQGEPDYVEVREGFVARQQVLASAPLASLPPFARHSGLVPAWCLHVHLQEEAHDFKGQAFVKCKPVMKLVKVDNPQVSWRTATAAGGGNWRSTSDSMQPALLAAKRQAAVLGQWLTSVICTLCSPPQFTQAEEPWGPPIRCKVQWSLLLRSGMWAAACGGLPAPPSSTPCNLQPVAQRVCAAGSPLPVGSRPSTTWPLGRTMWTPSAGSTPRRACLH